MKYISDNDVTKFIKHELKSKLQNDFSGKIFRIFRERDLHACTYSHLRRYFGNNSKWELLNEPLLRGLKGGRKSAHPDITTLRDGVLNLLLEYKYKLKHSGVQRKDQRVLKRVVKGKKWAKKVFYIEAIVERLSKTRRQLVKYRSKTLKIVMTGDRIEDYRLEYKRNRKPKPRI